MKDNVSKVHNPPRITWKPKKLTGNVNKPETNLEIIKSDYFLNLTLSACFKSFFSKPTLTIEKQSLAKSTLPNLPSSAGDSLEGCTMMRNFKSKDTKNTDKYAFESETVVKNGKIGIAIWILFNNLAIPDLRYTVLLLEKQESDKWNIKGGFSSNDLIDSSNKEIKSFDDSTIKVEYSKAKPPTTSSSISSWEHVDYSAIWESESNGKKSLEDVFQLIDKTKFSSNVDKEIFDKAYIISENEKISSTNDKKVTGKDLKSWYEPFKDKKGEWKKLEDYCKSEGATGGDNLRAGLCNKAVESSK